jgi:hypothetical protein
MPSASVPTPSGTNATPRDTMCPARCQGRSSGWIARRFTEEGITAAAYVVVNVEGRRWTIEECGKRDPSGACVGAILQGLIAREPIERRPVIRG